MKNFIGILTLFIFIACAKEEPFVPEPPIVKESVCLSELKAGQQSVYLQYTTTCANFSDDFRYNGNTLTLTILEKEGKLFAEEGLYYANLDTTYLIEYEVYNEGKFIVVPERWSSSLFSFYDNDRIDLQPESTITLSQNACQIFHEDVVFEGNDIGVLEQFKIGDIEESDLKLVSCEPIIQLEGYLMYNKNTLVASHTVILEGWDEPIPNQIQGWILKKE